MISQPKSEAAASYAEKVSKNRAERFRRMLRRINRLRQDAGLLPLTPGTTLISVENAVRRECRKTPGWYFRNPHEAFDCGCEMPLKRPGRATTARHGTAQKVAVMAARLEAGESLWHDEDGGE